MKKHKTYVIIGFCLSFYFIIVFIIYLVESNVPESNIKTFSDALWFSVVTLSSVGYGDKFPTTVFGKGFSLIFIIGSVGILGFVISRALNKIIKRMEETKLGFHGTKFENHVVIINWNDFSLQILKEIINAGKKAAVVTRIKESVDYIYHNFDSKLVFVLYHDFFDYTAFQKVNIHKSTSVLLNFDDDTENLVNLISLKKKYPNLNYVISLNNPSLKETFMSLGVTFTLSKNEVASKLVASYMFEPEVAKITELLMKSSTNENDLGMMQYKVVPENEYVNSKCLDLFIELKRDFNMVLIAISKYDGQNYKIIKNPTNEHQVSVDDYLVVIGNNESRSRIFTKFKVEEGI